MNARSLVAGPARRAARGFIRARTAGWARSSHLFAVGERTGWSVDEDARHVEGAARRLGYEVGHSEWARFARDQAVFLTSHFEALQPRWTGSSHRLATAYLHGRPGTTGYPEFDRAFEALRAAPDRLARIQVTHAEMHDLVLEAGVAPSAVHTIAIGIDIEHFPLVTPERHTAARTSLGLPTGAFVVGSFQKDGIGWGDGLEPKLIKGPDVLVGALQRIRLEVPELHVLLTGPARGYVCRELERLATPYSHVLATSRVELAQAYQAIDVCVVPARQEGGPKALLEAMASGVPLVSTRVGQAPELVEHGSNGWLVDVDDVESLADWTVRIRSGVAPQIIDAGRGTAEQYALERLDPAWAALLAGFVERTSS